jgi:ABC-type multidrug transport system fused ATPase/permease subunit
MIQQNVCQVKRDETLNENSLMKLIRRFGGYPFLIGLGVCALSRTVRDISCAVTLANTTDAVLNGRDVWQSVLLMMIAMFANIPINMAYNYFEARYSALVRNESMRAVEEKLPLLSASWLENQRTGEMISTCTSDVDQYLTWTKNGLAVFLQQGAYYIGAICYAWSQNGKLTFLTFPVVVLLVPLFGWLAKPLQKLTDRQRFQASNAMAQMQEVLTDPELIKAYELEIVMKKRVGDALEEQMDAQQKAGVYQGISQSLSNISGYLPGVIAAAVGVVFLIRGEVSAGFLVSFVQMALQRFSGMIPQLANVAALTRQAGVSARRICSLLDEPNEREDGFKELPDCPDAPVYEAEHITFSYNGGDAVLQDVSFRVEKGTTVAFVGASGSGKSTILSLLMGVYDPSAGKLCCMGRSVREWNLEYLRQQIAPVFQNTFLFPATVEENLSGQEKDREDRVCKALEEAGLFGTVEQMSLGIRTRIGERGSSLSGGQRQRMTIARAFYKDAPILLLDEPTSALDMVTEEQLQKSLRKLQKGRTTVVVAHRLKTIQEANLIYVMEKGRVVQQGTHEELFACKGVYRRLYEAQAKEVGEDG